MSNELNNMICRNSNGVYEGVAIGGDRYPGSRFIDHMLRYQVQHDVAARAFLELVQILFCTFSRASKMEAYASH
eukprot:4109924-Amphidinium_carterae.2